jgi:hypothetical protein
LNDSEIDTVDRRDAFEIEIGTRRPGADVGARRAHEHRYLDADAAAKVGRRPVRRLLRGGGGGRRSGGRRQTLRRRERLNGLVGVRGAAGAREAARP